MNIYDAFQADKLSLSDPGGGAMIKSWILAGIAILVVVLYGYRSLTRDPKMPCRMG
jgi:hypothetical protein